MKKNKKILNYFGGILLVLVLISLFYFGVSQTTYPTAQCAPFDLQPGDQYYGWELEGREKIEIGGDTVYSDIEERQSFLEEEEAFLALKLFISSKQWNPEPDYDFKICKVGSSRPSRCTNNYARCSGVNLDDLEGKYDLCDDGEEKCDGQESIICQDFIEVNMGLVEGKCGYTIKVEDPVEDDYKDPVAGKEDLDDIDGGIGDSIEESGAEFNLVFWLVSGIIALMLILVIILGIKRFTE